EAARPTGSIGAAKAAPAKTSPAEAPAPRSSATKATAAGPAASPGPAPSALRHDPQERRILLQRVPSGVQHGLEHVEPLRHRDRLRQQAGHLAGETGILDQR